ncbi:hypothetical protein LINPERHAP2_LOCUS24071 [Linum perenne]
MEEEEHEERDEEKIDKFFAIIRRLRDARRGSVSSSLRQLEVQRATSKKGKKIHVPPPCFELGSSKLPPCATEQESSSDREFVGEEEKGINLDLTL